MTSTQATRTRSARLKAVQHIAETVAGPAAAEVDRDARFPHEVFDALRNERLLAAFVPSELGGLDCDIAELAAMCGLLGQYCAASALIFAMHQIQVACIVRHGLSSEYFRDYLRRLSAGQHLVASVTSEVGVGGDLRTSLAAVTPEGPPWYRLVKQAPAISYGAHANELLVTARRTPEAPEGDQVLVLLELPEFELQGTSRWETLGMRGTCSPGFRLSARHTLDQILPVAFAEIASETMVPVSHILWSACWVGIATDAVRRARAFVRAEARGHPGSIPASVQKLAEMSTLLQTMRSTVDASAAEYQRLTIGADEDCRTSLNSVGFAISANNLKLAASELVVEIVMKALSTCGIAGYKIDSPYSVERHLRDALSAGLMIGNDRLRSANAALLLVQKEV